MQSRDRMPVATGAARFGLALSVGAILFLCLSCGDDSVNGFGAGAGPNPAAVRQCENLLELVCDMILECEGLPASDFAECYDVLDDELACDRAVATTASYGRCVATLEAECWSDALPPECQGVILLP